MRNPVRLGSGPEPDLAVLEPQADAYETATPRPFDVLLLVEVSDSTLRDDRDSKIPLYAERGASECWLVDIAGRTAEVFRQPQGGRYARVRHVGPEGTLDIAVLPGASLAAGDLFRPARSQVL